jgi:hypothetical protein
MSDAPAPPHSSDAPRHQPLKRPTGEEEEDPLADLKDCAKLYTALEVRE